VGVDDIDIRRFECLVAAVRARDVDAATTLFHSVHPQLIRYLRAKERGAADDLAGEVWLEVARRIDEFRGDQQDFRAWVFTLARRRIVDHRRRGLRRRTDPVDSRSLEERPAIDLTDAAALDRLGAQRAVDLLHTHLTDRQAEVVTLRVLGQLDARTVARMLGRSESWVRVTQHRALERLARRIGSRGVDR
jgi:RNA polymerase sigma-70 factor (ECF subfamily)